MAIEMYKVRIETLEGTALITRYGNYHTRMEERIKEFIKGFRKSGNHGDLRIIRMKKEYKASTTWEMHNVPYIVESTKISKYKKIEK